MAALPVFQDEVSTNSNRVVLAAVEGETDTYDITRDATITTAATNLSAAIMNEIKSELVGSVLYAYKNLGGAL